LGRAALARGGGSRRLQAIREEPDLS